MPIPPQAKGRVERAHLTLQDRLVKELRLQGISTPEAGNAYLPEFRADYNERFGHRQRLASRKLTLRQKERIRASRKRAEVEASSQAAG